MDANHIQQLASTPEYSVYLAASAGTGKTKVLTDRYLRLMLSGFPANKILCITFTNAAAAEMLDRIEGRLLSWQQASQQDLYQALLQLTGQVPSDDLIELARKQYQAFIAVYDQLKIQTLHAFCFDLLKKFSGVHHGMIGEIAPAAKLRELSQQALKRLFAAHEDIELQTHLETLIAFYDSNRLLELINEVLDDKLRFSSYIHDITDLKADVWQRYQAVAASSVQELIDNCYIEEKIAFLKKHATALQDDEPEFSDRVLKFCANPHDNWPSYQQLFLTTTATMRKKLFKAATTKKFPNILDFWEQEAQTVLDLYLRIISFRNAHHCHALLFLSQRFATIFEELKDEEQLLDYDDIIFNAIALLTDKEFSHAVLYRLDAAIEHVLVDEAQDLSVSQWQVIKLLTDEFFAGLGTRDFDRTIFIVGDFKQSIYSFQGADPNYFMQIKLYFRQKVQDALMIWHELDMQISFRSTMPVLNLVNNFFSQARNHLGLSEVIEHRAHRGAGGDVKIWEIAPPIEKENEIAWQLPLTSNEEFDNKLHNAQQIATSINAWLKEGRNLLGHNRPIVASDVMILVRKRGEIVQHLIGELEGLDIAVADSTMSSVREDLLIMDLLALISFICFPYDDYNLACLLKSPFFNCSEQQLFDFAHKRGESTLLDKIVAQDALLAEKLQQLLIDSNQLSLSQLLTNMVLAANINYSHSALQYFLEAVLMFEQEELNADLLLFFPWFDEYIMNNKFVVDQKDKVRIMTIHAAKGLQAPVVILADSASSEQMPHQNLFWQDNMPYFSTYTEDDCAILKDLKKQFYKGMFAENLRLLYVAITRAEDELYISGWHNNKLENSWYNKLRDVLTAESDS